MALIWQRLEGYFEGLEQLPEIYREIDARIAELQDLTGIKCLRFCKHCCELPQERIPVTVFETLPLCIYWYRTGQAEFWLNRLLQTSTAEPCVLLRREAGSKWGCRFHTRRPLLCRMFCFAAALDKQGQPQMALCPPLQQKYSGWKQQIIVTLPTDFSVPVYRDYAQRIAGLNPGLAKIYPINLALLHGLEFVGLKLRLLQEQDWPYGQTS